MNDNQLATLASWLRSEPLQRVITYANAIGINVDESDMVKLFHYIHATKEQTNAHLSLGLEPGHRDLSALPDGT
jgi:hypothetical protein